VVLLENVSGLASSAGVAFKEAICLAIEESGYRVDCDMLYASEFGVPQKRRPLFFLGVKPGVKLRWPKPTHGPGCKNPYVPVGDAVTDLPFINAGESADHYLSDPKTEYQKLMRKKASKTVHNHVAPKHPQETIDKIGNTKPGEPIYPKFAQRIRLSMDGLSPTQVSGGIRPQYQFGHPTAARGLTVRERCRLQSFPDRFIVHGGTVQGRVQTGNAVPPLLAKAIALQIKDMIQGKPLSEEKSIPAKPSQLSLIK
jgi:DNA (cytosine-5)-methyltransferase 1